jgi:hypothetical protein
MPRSAVGISADGIADGIGDASAKIRSAMAHSSNGSDGAVGCT